MFFKCKCKCKQKSNLIYWTDFLNKQRIIIISLWYIKPNEFRVI